MSEHLQMNSSDTIVAVASGGGRAAISVLRISGPETDTILRRLTGSLPPQRQASLRTLRDRHGEVLDRALILRFVAPASYTGESSAELHLHGGRAVTVGVLKALDQLGLSRLAQPGEFTRRAFLNGKLDLSEAEGVVDLIDAETDAQRRQALRQLDGALSQQVEHWREQLIAILAYLDASLDFSDEADVPEGLVPQARQMASNVKGELEKTLDDRGRGERLRDGFTVVIAGPPNAGKSTLMNRIAGDEVAIVSPIAGTTRDIIEVRCDLGGLPVVVIDTAGLRESDDVIEQEGVRRAKQRASLADLVLYLVPINDLAPSRLHLEQELGRSEILVIGTKKDLFRSPSEDNYDLTVSAETDDGIEALLALIKEHVSERFDGSVSLVTRERHRIALMETLTHLNRALALPDHAPTEILAEDIRLATRSLGKITGRVGVEDILDKLFSGFCIGK